MEPFHMSDVIPLLGLPTPPAGKISYYIPCPCCDDKPKSRHLNINLRKDVFRCPRCGFSGGVFDLYAYYARIPREQVLSALRDRLSVPAVRHTFHQSPLVEENPLTDVDARHATYTALLSRLALASDHRENLFRRGLSQEDISRLGYKTTPLVGCGSLAKRLQEEGRYLAGVPGFYKEDGPLVGEIPWPGYPHPGAGCERPHPGHASALGQRKEEEVPLGIQRRAPGGLRRQDLGPPGRGDQASGTSHRRSHEGRYHPRPDRADDAGSAGSELLGPAGACAGTAASPGAGAHDDGF